jgi:thiamine transport system permease protein
MGESEVEAARTLGASRLRSLLTITLPRLRSSVLAAASIVFLFSFTSFGIVMILGGVRQRTIEVEIYDQTARFLHLDVAAALSIMQLVGVVMILVLFSRARRSRSNFASDHAGTPRSRRARTLGERAFVGVNLLFMGLFLGGPLAVLVLRSFSTSDGWGLRAYSGLGSSRRGSSAFVAPLDAVGNSMRFAFATMAISVLLGCCAAWALARPRRVSSGRAVLKQRISAGSVFDSLTEGFLMIPLGTSAVTVGFGCLIALADPPLDLRSSWWMLPIAHSVIALPFVARLLVPAVRSIDPELRDAAALLGAGKFRVWFTVDLPMIRRQIAVAAGFAFAVSLGEFGATSFLVRARDVTVPIAIYRSLGRPGGDNLSQAMALAVILVAVIAVVVLIIDRLRPPTSAEF